MGLSSSETTTCAKCAVQLQVVAAEVGSDILLVAGPTHDGLRPEAIFANSRAVFAPLRTVRLAAKTHYAFVA